MDFLNDMRVLQDQLGDLARQNNEQALDLIQLRSKVAALGGGSGGGGIDVGGIIYASQADQKSTFTYGTTAHVFTPTPNRSFKPDTLYLVLSHVNVIMGLPSDADLYDAEMYIQMDLQSGSSPSGVTFNRTPSLVQLDTLRFTKTKSQSATENRSYTHSFIYGYKGYNGSIPLKYSGTIRALNYGTSTNLAVSGWNWGAAQYIAVPIGTY